MDSGINAPRHGKEGVYGINDIDKQYIYQLISNVQLPASICFDSHIVMHSSTQNNDVNMAKESQKNLYKEYQKYGVIDQGKYKNIQ